MKQNKYEKIKLVGQGTFGKVFLAVNKKTNEQYALKEVVQNIKYKNRQLGIISLLDHPNIIQMKDYFLRIQKDEQILCIIMEFMSTSLYSLMKEQRKLKTPIEPSKRKIIAFQLFKGLYYLALNVVCHRDLKPPNILLNTETYQTKICDFGSAKIIEKRENNVSYICSRYYRAPELILNSSIYGCEIDMWSAGCILVQLMTLQPLFPGDSSLEQLIQIIKFLGTPKKDMIKRYSLENAQIKLPKLKPTDIGKVLQRYNPDPLEIDLIKNILTYDTIKRYSPFEALAHPYFKDVGQLPQAKNLPDLLDFLSLKNTKNHEQIQFLQKLYECSNLPVKFSRQQEKAFKFKNDNEPDTLESTS